MIDGVMEKNDLPILFRKELEEYYYGIPLIRSEELLESIILNQVGYIMGTGRRSRSTGSRMWTWSIFP